MLDKPRRMKPRMIESSAAFSPCRSFRYNLVRIWNRNRPPLVFVMLNPSVAGEGAHEDDPTITRCIRFAERLGYGGIIVVNLYAFCATWPSMLRSRAYNGVDVCGPDNDQHIADALKNRATVVFAWGCTSGRPFDVHRRIERVEKIARRLGAEPHCLGYTKEGEPRHPGRLGYGDGGGLHPWPRPQERVPADRYRKEAL